MQIPSRHAYRPDPKSRTAQDIAWQIVCEEKMIVDALESGKAEWAPPPVPATMGEVTPAGAAGREPSKWLSPESSSVSDSRLCFTREQEVR